jgi:hypothetical protein
LVRLKNLGGIISKQEWLLGKCPMNRVDAGENFDVTWVPGLIALEVFGDELGSE